MHKTFPKALRISKITFGFRYNSPGLTRSGKWPKWCGKQKIYFSKLIVLLLFYLVTACKTDYQNLPAFSEQKQLQVVILTPAGSNHPQQYNSQTKAFANAQDAGLPEKIKFLPCPGNLGFIPSTAFKSSIGEIKPLPALVLSESVATGTVMEVIPVGTLQLNIAGETSYVVVTTPARPSEQIVDATSLAEFTTNYPAAKEILQKWFLNYNSTRKTRLLGWKDESDTENLIRRWLK